MSEGPRLLTHPVFVLCFPLSAFGSRAVSLAILFFFSELEGLVLICTLLVVNLVSLKCISNSFVEV